MSAKQDRLYTRTASDLERKYQFGKTFREILGLIDDAQDYADRAIGELDATLDHEEIFNRLTNNGAIQGIYRENGNIYINASYIKSGILLANLIKAGVLQSNDGETFYLDLDKGILKGKFTELSIAGKSIDEFANDAVANLSQEDIFNKLTNNGQSQGIFMENGDVFINASYLKSGALLADLIRAGVLQSNDGKTFYLDLDNGILKAHFTELSIAGKSVELIAQEKADVAESNAVKQAASIANDAVALQTQEDIFNKLTNYGQVQGLYMEDGKIYFNASFIKTGFLTADLIKAGVIRSEDFETTAAAKLYPGSIYPSATLYPNNGEQITRGMEIDFGAGVIRGVSTPVVESVEVYQV